MSEMEMYCNTGVAEWLEDRSSFGLFTTDPRLVVTGWNNWLESHSGRTRQKVMGKSLLDLYPDLVTRKMDRYFEEALEGRPASLSQAFHGYLLPIKCGDKESSDTIMAQSAIISPLVSDDGISGTITYIEDVSERVQREKELIVQVDEGKRLLGELEIHQTELEMQNEELHQNQLELEAARDKYSDLYDFAPVGYFTISEKGMILDANLTGATMLGVERRLLIGIPFSNFITEDTQDVFYLHRKELLETSTRQSFELRLKRKDGFESWTHLECIIAQDAEGTFNRIQTTVTNIDELKQSAEALRKRMKELKCLYSVAHIIENTDTIEELFQKTADIMPSGWHYPEIACARITYGDQEFKTENFQETAWEISTDMIVNGEPIGVVEVCYLEEMSDRDERPFLKEERDLVNAVAERLGRAAERIRGDAERKTLEIQLRQSQKMEAVSTLAGGIAHDFNNILAAILGYGELAQMKLDPESEVHTDLKEVLQSGNRAKLLIRQILAVGRSQEQERQPMQLKYIVREALKFLRSTLPSTIEIQEKIDKDIGVIDADPTQMHQVLMNLCTNAGHAMEKNGGILTVSLRNVAVVPGKLESGVNLEPGPYLRLSVSDTGYGIAPEIREQIFDPYFTTKELGVGTGIGLSVVHGIVVQHGGDIAVESEPGKGSTFYVYLPLTQAEEEQSEVKEETPLPKGTERILFVDDEAVLARMGKEMLESLGYDVTAMTGSLGALALFKEDPKQFDLVITDTTMPRMPGDILAQKIMETRPDIPVIICTGHSKRISKEKAEEMGIKGFLMKPPAMRDVANMVRKVLDER